MKIFSFALPLAVGGLAAWLTMGSMSQYAALVQPPLAPPSWLFPVVWTILFVLMGISAARIYIVGKQDRSGKKVRCGDNSDIGGQAACALRVYLVQLILNMLWTPLFFTLNLRLAAFVLLVMLLITVIVMTCSFFKLDKVSGILMLPYIAWLLFAGYLNLGTYILNG